MEGINNTTDLIKQINNIKKEQGISSYRLGELTELAPANIRRLFSGGQSPNLKTLVTICNALNIKIKFGKI